MNTILHIPSTPSLSFAWLRAVLLRSVRRSRPNADSPRELDVLAGLDARTLRDIGAPERMLARAITRHGDQRLHEDLTLGMGAAAWRHW